jgi:hypothetical protein
MALMLFFLMMLLIKVTNLPDWALPSLGLLLFLLCLLAMFFLLLQVVHAIRHRKSKTAASPSPADEQGTPWIASQTPAHLLVFITLFGCLFLWLHFAGPRQIVGYWIRHEPLAILPSATIAFFVALALTLFVVRRVG